MFKKRSNVSLAISGDHSVTSGASLLTSAVGAALLWEVLASNAKALNAKKVKRRSKKFFFIK
jgi:hypothetical protein